MGAALLRLHLHFGKLSSWLRICISDPCTASYSPHDESDPDCLYNLTNQLDLRTWSREDPTFPRRKIVRKSCNRFDDMRNEDIDTVGKQNTEPR